MLVLSWVSDGSSLVWRYRFVEPFFFSFSPPPRLLCYRVLGTLAAGIQSGIGNVAAGSLFATAQGAAMGAGTPVVAQVIGGVVTGIMGITAAILG